MAKELHEIDPDFINREITWTNWHGENKYILATVRENLLLAQLEIQRSKWEEGHDMTYRQYVSWGEERLDGDNMFRLGNINMPLFSKIDTKMRKQIITL